MVVKVFLRYVWAVGMHHHGPRELTVDALYNLKCEPQNPYDSKAVAVVDHERQDRVLAYLRRNDAALISKIFSENLLCTAVYLKPKSTPEVTISQS